MVALLSECTGLGSPYYEKVEWGRRPILVYLQIVTVQHIKYCLFNSLDLELQMHLK
jgi:hypothetical protein